MNLLEKINNYLNERLMIFGGDYGQIVFMAGGGGSGKGFVIQNFMEGNKFKVRDVDAWKEAFLRINKLKGKYSELEGLNLKNPKDVFELHKFIKNKGIKHKTLDLLLTDLKQDRLPNILFDITFKEMGDITEILPTLIELGYDSNNVHLVWVLTNYRVAVQRNQSRDRVVPEDVLLQTHEGAAKSVYDLITGQSKIKGLDGKINVVLNNQENTVFYTDKQGNKIKTGKNKTPVIKDFLYMNVKERGKSIKNKKELQKSVFNWIKDNVPKTFITKDMFEED